MMRREEFMERLCEILSTSKDLKGFQHFPCVCGENPLSQFDSDCDKEQAELVLLAVEEALK